MNYCLYIGCRRKCDDLLYCNPEHELKQRRVVAVLAERNPVEARRREILQRRAAAQTPHRGWYGTRSHAPSEL